MDGRADNAAIPKPCTGGCRKLAKPLFERCKLRARLAMMCDRIGERPNKTQGSVEALKLRSGSSLDAIQRPQQRQLLTGRFAIKSITYLKQAIDALPTCSFGIHGG